jgi:glutamate/tyrosine decarboxylase-like PLP-dependent enzyme
MDNKCKSDEIALKSFFLGPQAENADFITQETSWIMKSWINWRKNRFPEDGVAISDSDKNDIQFKANQKKFHIEIEKFLEKLSQEIPKFSPRYIGHMFSDVSLPALFGHIITLLHNPNNVSHESSLVGVEIEKEAINDLAKMFGYPKNSSGHFTSGGTIANFESLIRAKRRWINNLESNWENGLSFSESCYIKERIKGSTVTNLSDYGDINLSKLINKKFNIEFQGPVLIVPDSKHYSWSKAASLFGIGNENLKTVEINKFGQMDIHSLSQVIEKCLFNKNPILSVVSICGTTELGTVDPIEEVQSLLDSYKADYGYSFWHHIDAAYGGFFATLKNTQDPSLHDSIKKSLQALSRSTSITVDPHKLGYVPYSSGAFLCRDDLDYFNHEISAPYVDFQGQLDRGPYTLEGSRSAAGAVATNLTANCIGFNENGYGQILLRTIKTRNMLQSSLQDSNSKILFLDIIGTNILCFCIGQKNSKLSEINKNTVEVINKFNSSHGKNKFYISKTILSENFKNLINNFCFENEITQDQTELVVIRLTLMNPFISSVNPNVNFIKEFTETIKSWA